jgi:hypothetical protein
MFTLILWRCFIVGFEVLTALTVMGTIFWDVADSTP